MKIPISLFILIAIVFGLILPYGILLEDLFFPIIFILMYLNVLGLKLTLKKFFRRELIYPILVNIIVLPLFAYFIGSFLSPYLLFGVVIGALAPTAMNSTVYVNLVDGDKELSVFSTFIMNLIYILYVPLMFFILLRLEIVIPYEQILMKTFSLIIVPIFLAILTTKALKEKRVKIINFSKKLNLILLPLLLWIIFSINANEIWSSLNEVLITIPVMFLVSIVGFLLGYLAVKKKSLKRTLAIVCGYKNQSLSLGIVYGLNPLAVIPITVYLLFNHMINLTIIWLFEKKKI
ncbi:MAG: hypothetical protein GTN36_01775 [Candidatus Aenigmarchaeota archaeon]|nr:hypothetical protein [Candidatus Aenigmarchaeota archaeon]